MRVLKNEISTDPNMLNHFFITSIAHTHSSKKPSLSVMTFNIENGGTQIGFNQVVKAIQQSKADVVGIQEAWGNITRLTKTLKWKYYDPNQHVISRFPLFKNSLYPDCVFIEVEPKRFFAMANLHLPDEPYGPTLIQQGFNEATVIKNEKKVRLGEAKLATKQLATLAKKGIPVFLTGDFNSPSHLDWAKKTLQHRYVVHWPVTEYVLKKGLIDSYRQIVPNPYQYPGYTWPAKRPRLKNAIDNYNPSSQDVPERLDFIFYGGPAQVLDSKIVGEKKDRTIKIAISP